MWLHLIVFRTRRRPRARSRNRKMAFVKHEEKLIEDEDDNDIIAVCILPASYRRGEIWIALLVNFRSNIKISLVLSSVRLYQQIEQFLCNKRVATSCPIEKWK